MFAKLRLTFLRSTVAVILAAILVLPGFSERPRRTFTDIDSIEACLNLNFFIISSSQGVHHLDLISHDPFFVGLQRVGYLESFKLTIDTNNNTFFGTLKLNGMHGRITAYILGTTSGPDAQGTIKFTSFDVLFIGGSGDFFGASGIGFPETETNQNSPNVGQSISFVNILNKNADGTLNGLFCFFGFIKTTSRFVCREVRGGD